MFLGIDVGTSGVKAVLMDPEGDVVAQATAPLSVSRPYPLWSEQEPEDWWQAANAAVLSLPQSDRNRVEAVGLSGQMHGATLLDESDDPIRPAILWNDGRSHGQCSVLEDRVPELHDIAGNLAMPGFTAPKLVWMAEHEPEAFAKVEKVLLPKDYVRLRMTGDYASDMSDAAGTLWMDVGARDWSDRLLGACGLSREHMPDLFEGCEVTGEVLNSVAAVWGLPEGTPVVAGGGDNAAGAVGAGIIAPGDTFLSLGTSGVLFTANTSYRPDAKNGVHTFCHALPTLWHQMAVMLSAASCVDWAVRLTGAASPEQLIADAERADRFGADTPTFLPYLSGERTPHNDPNATGMLFGMTHDSGASDIAQAVLEGVAHGFADGLAALSSGADIETITVIGGGSRSAYWGRILSAALSRPLIYRKYADVGPALGAARLAQMAANGEREASFPAPEIEHVVEPDPSDVEIMSAKLARYRELYTRTKDLN